MRICCLADAISIHTQRWVKYFADKGHEVHLISAVPLGDGNIGNTELYVLKKFRPQIRIISFPLNLLSDVIQVRKLTKKIKPAILHAHYITDCGLLGALTGFHPFVVWAMGSDILVEPKQHGFARLITKYVLRKADLIICGGENLVEKVIKLGANRERIKVSNLGVDTQKFRPLPASRSVKKKELGLSDTPTIISTRSLNPVYDIETLIKAIPSVLEKVPEAKFVIAGQGSEEDYLKELAKSLGVSDSARFVGWIAHDDLPKYLASSDVYVSTSLSDSGPVSTLEAMACELPVVVTDSGEHRNWIKDDVNGFIVPMRSPESLASKIIYLLENENDRVKSGKANRLIAEQKAYYKREVEKLEKLYQELISKKK